MAPLFLFVLALITWSINNRTPSIKVPRSPSPTVNGFDDFVAAARIAMLNEVTEPTRLVLAQNVPVTDAQLALHERALKPALELVKRGLMKPCVYPSPKPGDTSRDDEPSNFRQLMRSIVSIGRQRALSGKLDEAIDFWLDGIDVAIRTSYGANSTLRHSNYSCASMSLSCLDAYRLDFTPKQLRRIHARLAAAETFREPVAVVLKRDGWLAATSNMAALKDPHSYGSWAGTVKAAKGRRLLLAAKSFNDFITLHDEMRNDRATWGDRRDAIVFLFGNKQSMLEENLAYQEAYAAAVARNPYVTPRIEPPRNMMAWSEDSSLSLFYRDEASWEIARAQIALLLFRAEHRVLPTRIDELTPNYLKRVPRDPYAGGKALTYRRTKTPAGFLLYSFGVDQRDDGGQPLAKGVSGFDIVAGSSDHLRKGFIP